MTQYWIVYDIPIDFTDWEKAQTMADRLTTIIRPLLFAPAHSVRFKVVEKK